jgi:excinuclease UvrABC nuclease subunit
MQRQDLDNFKLPDGPGIYRFKEGNRILYIGKAASLRDRVRSYFSSNLPVSRAAPIVEMVGRADSVSWQVTDSVLEALILEANLIKRHQPEYNVASKDNKSFNYLVITKEDFPRVLPVRGRKLFQNWNASEISTRMARFHRALHSMKHSKLSARFSRTVIRAHQVPASRVSTGR